MDEKIEVHLPPNLDANDVINGIKRNAKTERGKPIPCERCKREWTPTGWCFYGLCNHCFGLFDQQKMAARFGNILENKGIKGFESSTEWIKACPYIEGEPSSGYNFQEQMTAFFAKLEAEGKLKTVEIKNELCDGGN